MGWLNGQKFRRAGGCLCATLMLVFALASAANAVNRVQHLGGEAVPHQHGLFAETILEPADHDHDSAVADHHSDHDEDHHGALADSDDEDAAHPSQGAAHHHGDTGASLIVLTSLSPDLVTRSEQRQGIAFARFEISVRQVLPERPPRTSHIAI